jgi:hypothetical protein
MPKNVIFLELLRRGYEVYIGKADAADGNFFPFGKLPITIPGIFWRRMRTRRLPATASAG